MDSENAIIVGVISGILASTILFIAAKLFENTVLPALRKIIYSGIDVSGPWHWENRFGSVAKMELKQYADRLDGTFTYVNSSSSTIKTFSIYGHIQDRFIQLTLRSNDQKRLGVLSYVFEVVGDGCELRGCSSFYSTSHHRIASEEESFFRDPAIAKKKAQELKIETQKFLSSLLMKNGDIEAATTDEASIEKKNSEPPVEQA